MSNAGVRHDKYSQAAKTNAYQHPNEIIPIEPVNHHIGMEEILDLQYSEQKKAEQLCYYLYEFVRIVYGEDAEIPPVKLDTETYLGGAATYIDDSIIIRTSLIQYNDNADNKKLRMDDLVSIMMHEYKHYLNEKQGLHQAVQPDGSFISFETDIDNPVPEITDELKQQFIDNGKSIGLSGEALDFYVATEVNMSQATTKWTYGPSNLAMDEISAYTHQIWLHDNGYLEMSDFKYQETLQRIEEFEGKRKQRLAYEKEHGLGPDGLPLKTKRP